MAVIGINYREGKHPDLKYESVSLRYSLTRQTKLFNTGNFCQDWYDCMKFIINELTDEYHISHSSSVDHFIMDNAPYESAYLHCENDVWMLKYVDQSDPNYIFTQSDIYEKGIEFFVEAGTKPTWEEFKIMYGKKN